MKESVNLNIKQKVAPASFSIYAITLLTFAFMLVMLAAAIIHIWFLLIGVVLAITMFICFLWTPVAYELSEGELKVIFRAGVFKYGPVIKCSQVGNKSSFAFRVLGNGGIFAGTGIYWNTVYGVFRAYVTSSREKDLVMIETEYKKIIISPEKPEEFLSVTDTEAETK